MHVGAPRCQPKYLKWLCDHSRIDSSDSSSNGFVLPESDHKNTFLPPTPFLIVAKESLVTMCGQILHKCGLIHLGASCLAAFQFTQARAIETKCDTKNKFTVRNYLDIFFLIYKRLNPILYIFFFTTHSIAY